MKKSIMHFIIIIFFFSCSNGPEDILLKVRKYYNEGDYENVKACYTAGTARAMEELEKITAQPNSKRLNISKKFMEGSSWEIVRDDIKGDAASLTIKYLEHPVENMRGLNITFRLKQENGKWKIDEEKEIRENIDLIRKSGNKNKLKNYKR